MNALHPSPDPEGEAARPAPAWPDAARTVRLVHRSTTLYLAYVLASAALLLAFRTAPAIIEARSGGLAGLALGSLLLPLTGLLATVPLVRARARLAVATPRRPWRRFDRLRPAPVTPARHLAWLARRPQGVIVPILAAGAFAAAWWLRPQAVTATPDAVLLGGAAMVLAFPLLIAERVIRGVGPSRLPEAPGLQALALAPVIILPVAGVLEIASGLGAAWPRPVMTGLAFYVCLVAAELAIRALANWFLPLPAPMAARAAIGSVTALVLQPGRVAQGGIAAPLKEHLGLDFSRSWALRYVRSAAIPVTLLIALIGWAISGVTLINLDQRGVYERFGAPVVVWQPGAHAGLPWPLGRVRLVDLGVVHSVALGGDDPNAVTPGAEGPAPAAADRLWDAPHPAEVSYIIASVESSGAQSFQTVSVDMRVLYGVGADDVSAMRAAYAVVSPDDLVRAEAGRLLARFFAGQTLDAVLGDNREALAETLRTRLQAELDAERSGLVLAGLVIEAIHPPPAAAEAYHNVQAAEIIANTAIATERGRAQAAAAMARQVSTGLTDTASGAAAETVAQASTAARNFTADRDAASAGGQAFLLERYFTNLSMALAKSPLVIVDHRLAGADAPTIDLRTFATPAGRGADDD